MNLNISASPSGDSNNDNLQLRTELCGSAALQFNEESSRGFFHQSNYDVYIPPRVQAPNVSYPERTQGICGHPIVYSIELAKLIFSYLNAIAHKDWRFEIVPNELRAHCGGELKRYMCAVQAYINSKEHVLSKDFLINGILDKDFASKLKKIRKYSFIRSTDNIFSDTPEDVIDFETYEITDIGQIFNYSYCFFWKEEDSEDYKLGLEPVNIADEDLEEYISSVFHLLPEFEDIQDRIIPEEEILLQMSSSMGMAPCGKLSPVYMLKETMNQFSKEPLHGIRKVINVGPANTRDSVILSVPQSNSVKLIDAQCREIVKKMKYSLHIRDPTIFSRKLKKKRMQNNFFFDRDIEKEGITKPRQLIKGIFAAMRLKWKNHISELPFLKYETIFDDFILDIEDVGTIHLDRGHGLGMANALTTIMQCALFKTIKDRMESETGRTLDIDAIFLNDDGTILFKDEDLMEDYDDFEDTEMAKFCIKKKKSKSSKGEGTVFCEQYYYKHYREMNDKRSYFLNEMYRPFSAHNILNAKMIMSNMSFLALTGDKGKSLIYEYISFWGYEFFEGEWNTTSSFGGWFSLNFGDVNMEHVYNPELTRQEHRAMMAIKKFGQIRKLGIKRDNTLYRDPIYNIYGILDLPDSIRSRIGYCRTKREVAEQYHRISDRKSLERAYDYLQTKRLGAYKKYTTNIICMVPTIKYEMLKDLYKDKVILPHQSIVDKNLYEVYDENEDKLPFISPTPLLSMLKFYNPDKIKNTIYPEERTFLLGRQEIMTKTDKDQLERLFSPIKEPDKWDNHYLSYESDIYFTLFEKRYYKKFRDPNAVVQCWRMMNRNKFFPLEFFEERNSDDYAELLRELDSGRLRDFGSLRKNYQNYKFFSDFSKEEYEEAKTELDLEIKDFKEQQYKRNLDHVTSVVNSKNDTTTNFFALNQFWEWYSDPSSKDITEKVSVAFGLYAFAIKSPGELGSRVRESIRISKDVRWETICLIHHLNGGTLDESGDLCLTSELEPDLGGGLFGEDEEDY
jgi:hypothetical protein